MPPFCEKHQVYFSRDASSGQMCCASCAVEQPPTDYEIVRCMHRFGGSFVRHLAELCEKADPVNFAKIKATWPDYWQRYAEMVPHMKARDEAQQRLEKAGERNG